MVRASVGGPVCIIGGGGGGEWGTLGVVLAMRGGCGSCKSVLLGEAHFLGQPTTFLGHACYPALTSAVPPPCLAAAGYSDGGDHRTPERKSAAAASVRDDADVYLPSPSTLPGATKKLQIKIGATGATPTPAAAAPASSTKPPAPGE